jgi:hypothetical protein
MKKEKESSSIPEVNAFINDELSEGSASGGDQDQKLIKSLLTVPYNSPRSGDMVLRVGDELYASTRLNTLTKTDTGFEADVTGKNLIGKSYDLRVPGSSRIIQTGKIAAKAANSIHLHTGTE